MRLKFNDYEEGFGSEFLCPSCGSNYLHHDQVDIFERSEDAVTGIHVRVADGQAIVDSSLRGNPSSRRHGLSINLWCEGCHSKLTLTVAQHKGTSLVDIIDTGEKVET